MLKEKNVLTVKNRKNLPKLFRIIDDIKKIDYYIIKDVGPFEDVIPYVSLEELLDLKTLIDIEIDNRGL